MIFPFNDDNPIDRTPLATYALIAINVLGFLWVQQLPTADQQIIAYRHGFVPARIDALVHPRQINFVVKREVPHRVLRLPVLKRESHSLKPIPRQVFASLVTCMFLHGGWLHLIGNMWFLWVFGNNVEDRLGLVPFLILYLVGGLIASGSHWMVDPASTTPVIGASGAVAAVLGAYAVTWPFARVHTLIFLFVFFTIIDLPALFVLGGWFIYQLVAGQLSLQQEATASVARWAHVGGFVAGMVLMPGFSAAVGAKPTRGFPKAHYCDDSSTNH